MKLLRNLFGSRAIQNIDTRPRLGWLSRAKAGIQGRVLVAAEALGAVASAMGVPILALTGKLYLAVLVALFGMSCCLRLVRLRQRFRQRGHAPAQVPLVSPAPAWLTPAVGVVSAAEVALLVESTRLPVRADQPGFDTANWWWVLAGFLVLFLFQRSWLMDRLSDKASTRHEQDTKSKK